MVLIRANRLVASFGGLLLCLTLLTSVVLAQSTRGLITGTVTDASGSVLKGAQVELNPEKKSVYSDSVGGFSLSDVAAGHYTLTIRYVGFEPLSRKVDVIAGQTLNLPVHLLVASRSEDILVNAERVRGEADAINQTRAADNILQSLPAEVITSLPNANVADAIGRLPSVVLYRIEGEGVYVQVRGTEPRLTNVTVDGITLPAPEPSVRSVRLDVIPSELVESVEISKTLSASQDANGIGGSVNLRTKSAGDEPRLDLFTKGGYTPILNGRASSETGGTYSQRYGKAKRFGLLLNGSYDYNGRGIDNIQPTLDPYSTMATPFYDNDTIREYRYYRHRYGFAGSADYKVSDRTSLTAHGIFSDLKDYGDKWYYAPYSLVLASTGVPSKKAAKLPKFYTSSKRPDAAVSSLSLGLHHYDNNSWYNVIVSASRSWENDSAGNPKADFSWIGSTLSCDFVPSAQKDKYRPTFGVCDQANSPLLDATKWAFADITTSTGHVGALDLSGAVSYARNYTRHGHFGSFEMGFKIANSHKAQDATEVVYDGWNATAAKNVATMATLQSEFTNTDYYNGSYFGGKFGPVSDFNKVSSFTLANLSGDIDQYKTLNQVWPNRFHYVERIPAGYLMNTIDLGRLHLQTGVRIEATQMDTTGYTVQWSSGAVSSGTSANQPTRCANNTVLSTSKNCYSLNQVSNNPSYVDVLPSVQMRYGLTTNSNLRAVYSRGVARPDPYQLVPYVTADESANTAAIGNPSLRPEHANNYDLLYEAYLHPLGMIQAGVFFKQLTAPQVTFQIPTGVNVAALPAGTIPAWMLTEIENAQSEAGSGSSVTQYVNGQNARLYGFEVSFQQHFGYLPGVLGGLGLSANYSYTGSQMKGLWLRSDHPRLLDQAANAWNISPTYDTKRFSLRVGMTYNDKNLFSYNWISPTLAPGAGADPSGLGATGPSGDVWTLSHMQIDAQATYRVWRNLSVLVSGLNLNNEVFGYYTGSDQFVNQREYYKPTYTGGLRYNFGQHHEAR